MKPGRGVGELTAAITVLAITVIGGLILYSGLRGRLEEYSSVAEYPASLLYTASKTMVKPVLTYSNNTSTLILLYNYGDEDLIVEKVVFSGGTLNFTLKVYDEGWRLSVGKVMPSRKLSLLVINGGLSGETVVLIFRSGVWVGFEV